MASSKQTLASALEVAPDRRGNLTGSEDLPAEPCGGDRVQEVVQRLKLGQVVAKRADD